METLRTKCSLVVPDENTRYLENVIGQWVHKKFGTEWRPEPGKAWGFISNTTGELVAGFTFQEYTGEGGTVFLNISAEPKSGWFTEQTLKDILEYTFNQMKVKNVRCKVLSHNLPSMELCKKFGWEVETVLKDFDPKGDMTIFKMDRALAKKVWGHIWKDKENE